MQVLQVKIRSLFSTALESEYGLFALLSSVYSPAPPTVFSCFQLDLQNIQNPRRKGRGEECTPQNPWTFSLQQPWRSCRDTKWLNISLAFHSVRKLRKSNNEWFAVGSGRARIRTRDLRLRRPTHYPAVLHAQPAQRSWYQDAFAAFILSPIAATRNKNCSSSIRP